MSSAPAGTGAAGAVSAPALGKVLLVGAGKGGVGKSTVALNLAVGLALDGARVGLLDADIHGPSIPLMTGLAGRPVFGDGVRVQPLEAHGIKVMSIGLLVPADDALVMRGPMIAGAVTQLLGEVDWGTLDYLVLDLPPGTGDIPLTLAQQVRAAGAVLVSTPQDVALADVIRARQMFEKLGVPLLGIVENMSGFLCPCCGAATNVFDRGGARLAGEKLGLRFLGELPLDLAVREGGDAGVPIVAGRPGSPQAEAFLAMARNVARAVTEEAARRAPAPAIRGPKSTRSEGSAGVPG